MSGCRWCAAAKSAPIVERGELTVLLAGNPNTGKSTVFNGLTGLRQRTGNWTGKTVRKAEGSYVHRGKRVRVVDLPGTYSLLSNSPDEEVARNAIVFDNPDATVVVVDATCLERNLNLVLQILEMTGRVVVALNLMDEAERKGLRVDAARLAKDLGVPVVSLVANRGRGLARLREAIIGVAIGEIATNPRRPQYSGPAAKAIREVAEVVRRLVPQFPNPEWAALRLLEGDPLVESILSNGGTPPAPAPKLRTEVAPS